MTLEDIKQIAYTHPDQIQICWDKLDSDPKYKEDFEAVVSNTLLLLPEIENIYKKLTTGKSVAFEGHDTPLKFEDIEQYTELVTEELFSRYQMEVMWDKYKKVKEIVGA
jgi:hypothetical protein